MKVLEGLKYSKEHEWVKVLEEGKVSVGITDFAQDELGDIVFVTYQQSVNRLKWEKHSLH